MDITTMTRRIGSEVRFAGVTALLGLALTASPVMAATSSLSFNVSPIAPSKSGTYVTFGSGGGTNYAWVKAAVTSLLNPSIPSGSIVGGLNSAKFTFGGVTGGTLRVSLSGTYTYSWTCSSIPPIGQAQGRASILIRLYDVTAARSVGTVEVYSWDMPMCFATVISQNTGTTTMPGTHSTTFSGSRLVKGHVYQVLSAVQASVATTATMATATLQVSENAVTGTIAY